ncbi:unnamed protein product [Caenorhabditis nigoni]
MCSSIWSHDKTYVGQCNDIHIQRLRRILRAAQDSTSQSHSVPLKRQWSHRAFVPDFPQADFQICQQDLHGLGRHPASTGILLQHHIK